MPTNYRKIFDITIQGIGLSSIAFLGYKAFSNSIEIAQEIKNIKHMFDDMIKDTEEMDKRKRFVRQKKLWVKEPQELYFTEFFPPEYNEYIFTNIVNDENFGVDQFRKLQRLKIAQDNKWASEYINFNIDELSGILSKSNWALKHLELWYDKDDIFVRNTGLKLEDIKSTADLPSWSIIKKMRERVAENRMEELMITGIDPITKKIDSTIDDKKKGKENKKIIDDGSGVPKIIPGISIPGDEILM